MRDFFHWLWRDYHRLLWQSITAVTGIQKKVVFWLGLFFVLLSYLGIVALLADWSQMNTAAAIVKEITNHVNWLICGYFLLLAVAQSLTAWTLDRQLKEYDDTKVVFTGETSTQNQDYLRAKIHNKGATPIKVKAILEEICPSVDEVADNLPIGLTLMGHGNSAELTGDEKGSVDVFKLKEVLTLSNKRTGVHSVLEKRDYKMHITGTDGNHQVPVEDYAVRISVKILEGKGVGDSQWFQFSLNGGNPEFTLKPSTPHIGN